MCPSPTNAAANVRRIHAITFGRDKTRSRMIAASEPYSTNVIAMNTALRAIIRENRLWPGVTKCGRNARKKIDSLCRV